MDDKIIKNEKKLTIIVPFKNRYDNLKVFIPYMNHYFKNNFPEIDYKIVIMEQENDKPFNKGLLLNIGFLLTSGFTDYYAIHDVDELPISAKYYFTEKPFHIAVNIFNQGHNGDIVNHYEKEGFQHKGSCVLISKECYLQLNGHSNLYWGWGPVDVNFDTRMHASGIGFNRWKTKVDNDNGYFIELKTNHVRYLEDPLYLNNELITYKTFNKEIDWKKDGLNSIKGYEVLKTDSTDDYIKYVVDFEDDLTNMSMYL